MRVIYLRRALPPRSHGLFDEIFYMEGAKAAFFRKVGWTEHDGVSWGDLNPLKDANILRELESISAAHSVQTGSVYLHFAEFDYDDEMLNKVFRDVSQRNNSNDSGEVREFLHYVESL